eukprot:XP_011661557.1 PREDICTED: uncharacterized family 31 glucosidase KIAA1161-like [Strongylocentrotus purpuratus]
MSNGLMLGVKAAILTAAIIAAVLCGMLLIPDKDDPQRDFQLVFNDDVIEIKNAEDLRLIRGQVGVMFEEGDAQQTPCTKDESVIECYEWPSIAKLEVRIEEDENVTCHDYQWRASAGNTILQDCYEIDEAHWYGGAAIFNQHWPINEWNEPMTIFGSANMYRNPTWYGSLVERYFVSSKGVGVRVSHNTPLYVSINASNDGKICFRGQYPLNADSYSSYPNPNNDLPVLDYKICTAKDVVTVHEYMSKRFVKKPTGMPDTRMMKSPVWSTWARYKKFINDRIVLAFAHEIIDNGFNNSQIEIDDGYSYRNFGDFIFDPEKFPDPKNMTDELHALGFRVTLWITPFANQNTEAWKEGDYNDYWVKDSVGNTAEVFWWNGPRAGMIDVTNPKAVDWFVGRLKQAQADYGIDSFKFDAGETQYLSSYHTKEPLINPCEFTTKWVQLAGQLGNLIEVRSSFENQGQSTFLRMMDKDSHWGWDNGLKTLITTALTYSVLGYSYVLPDMIGGNGYPFFSIFPDRELYVRWLQINAFLPAMQYSISPWQYNDTEIVEIALRWTSFHENVVTPKMIKLAEEEYITEGKPLVRPLWWIAPTDPETFVIDSQFLVGDDMLVAPIVNEGARSRDVYLPAGQWKDEIHNLMHEGGTWLRDVNCELDEILYYTKQDN